MPSSRLCSLPAGLLPGVLACTLGCTPTGPATGPLSGCATIGATSLPPELHRQELVTDGEFPDLPQQSPVGHDHGTRPFRVSLTHPNPCRYYGRVVGWFAGIGRGGSGFWGVAFLAFAARDAPRSPAAQLPDGRPHEACRGPQGSLHRDTHRQGISWARSTGLHRTVGGGVHGGDPWRILWVKRDADEPTPAAPPITERYRPHQAALPVRRTA